MKILSFSADFSTRYSMEVSCHPGKYELEFADTEAEFLAGVKKFAHDLYIAETGSVSNEGTERLLRGIAALKPPRPPRLIIMVDELPDENAAPALPVPVTFMESIFTRKRLDAILAKALGAGPGQGGERGSGGAVISVFND